MNPALVPLPDRVDVVIVGGGLAGLAVARAVETAGRTAVVVEACDGVGGRVRTDVVDGFRLDRGFQVLLTAYPEVSRQLDLPALRPCAFDPGSLVWLGKRMYAIGDPTRKPGMLFSSAFAPVGSVTDKVRLAGVLHRLRKADPVSLLHREDVSTLTSLLDQGFSTRMIDRFFRPLLGGIQLDVNLSASRRMADIILRCLAVGDSVVPAMGMQAIPDQLAAGLLPGTLHLDCPVAAVAPGEVRLIDGRVVHGQRVVVATEGPAAAELLRARQVVSPGSRAVSCVWFAAPKPPVDDKLIVLDGTITGPAVNVAVMSNVSPDYAPQGQALIAAACPAADGDLTALPTAVQAQMRRWWGAQVDEWRVLRTDTIAHGQPDSQPPFVPKKPVALGDGLFVCGDHRDTPSIQGALYSGRRTAEAVLASLG
ncbi:MAG TPA: NAD(P)/FAD-dependent oxidoreductase [Ilumatobacteraceae bacterium]|nr:NAD(P)/FAD-dependent oxidoreductase [Ilumatobacteraceae bacterium]